MENPDIIDMSSLSKSQLDVLLNPNKAGALLIKLKGGLVWKLEKNKVTPAMDSNNKQIKMR